MRPRDGWYQGKDGLDPRRGGRGEAGTEEITGTKGEMAGNEGGMASTDGRMARDK